MVDNTHPVQKRERKHGVSRREYSVLVSTPQPYAIVRGVEIWHVPRLIKRITKCVLQRPIVELGLHGHRPGQKRVAPHPPRCRVPRDGPEIVSSKHIERAVCRTQKSVVRANLFGRIANQQRLERAANVVLHRLENLAEAFKQPSALPRPSPANFIHGWNKIVRGKVALFYTPVVGFTGVNGGGASCGR